MKDEKPKTFLGMPMNWDQNKLFKNLWNPDDSRLFPPKTFGIGWTINFYEVLRRAKIIKPKKAE